MGRKQQEAEIGVGSIYLGRSERSDLTRVKERDKVSSGERAWSSGSPCFFQKLVLESVDKGEPLKSLGEGGNTAQID